MLTTTALPNTGTNVATLKLTETTVSRATLPSVDTAAGHESRRFLSEDATTDATTGHIKAALTQARRDYAPVGNGETVEYRIAQRREVRTDTVAACRARGPGAFGR